MVELIEKLILYSSKVQPIHKAARNTTEATKPTGLFDGVDWRGYICILLFNLENIDQQL